MRAPSHVRSQRRSCAKSSSKEACRGRSHQWVRKENGEWEVSFSHNGQYLRATFSPEGDWLGTTETVTPSALPQVIREKLSTDLRGATANHVEAIDHPVHGKLYEVWVEQDGRSRSIRFLDNGELHNSLLQARNPQKNFEFLSTPDVLWEFGFNLVIILIFAWGIYYRRHHDHEMLFLLLGFNLFLFPIFLVSNNLTAGMGFTIFALLALVRLRSDPFSKTEIAYLLGAVSLTFINGQLAPKAEVIGAGVVLATAWLADHPKIWKDPKHSINLRYPMTDSQLLLDRAYLKKKISEEFHIEVVSLRITSVQSSEVRLTVNYRDIKGTGPITGPGPKEA